MGLESAIDKVNADRIEKLTLIGGFIFTIISVVYFVVNYFYNQMYKQKNQSYYGIPSKYFQGSIEDKVFYLILVIVLICIIFSSLLLLYKNFIKNRTAKSTDKLMAWIITVAMGFTFSILNIKNLFDIIEIIENNKFVIFVNNHMFGASMIIVMLSIVEIICITYNDEIGSKLNEKWKKYFNMFTDVIFVLLIIMLIVALGVKFSVNNHILKLSIVITILSVISIICIMCNNEKWKKYFNMFAWVIFGLSFIMLIVALGVKFSYNAENKTIYETTVYEDKNMAILSDLDDKVLIVEYEINKNKEAMLKTYNYMIVDKENLVISYKDLGEKIIVVKE